MTPDTRAGEGIEWPRARSAISLAYRPLVAPPLRIKQLRPMCDELYFFLQLSHAPFAFLNRALSAAFTRSIKPWLTRDKPLLPANIRLTISRQKWGGYYLDMRRSFRCQHAKKLRRNRSIRGPHHPTKSIWNQTQSDSKFYITWPTNIPLLLVA